MVFKISIGIFLANMRLSLIIGGRIKNNTKAKTDIDDIKTIKAASVLLILFLSSVATIGFKVLIKIKAKKSAYINSRIVQIILRPNKKKIVKMIVFGVISIFWGIL